ncbi:NAD(P)H-binding protein [Planktotalea sp.]|uniref:NAD(P)H-binding protein n=1 Tax=Planktotalea sp. TaxID=2029877 RepID=UPI0035C87A8C
MQKRVLLLGATGTAGQGAARALLAQDYDLTCVLRDSCKANILPEGAKHIIASITDFEGDQKRVFKHEYFDVVVSCLASRTGAPKDAWAIDHAAQLNALSLAKSVGAKHFVLLSAICVQRPKLAFQHAKLAFEEALISSGLTYSIVRPTAFFKSLSGQIERVRNGKGFLVFGDGTLTSCTPLSDDDLGRFLANCIADETKHNQILPIGGPGPAITPIAQGEELARLLGKPVKIKHVPVALLDVIYWVLRIGGLLSKKLAENAELAQIGRYYATESMLVWNAESGAYDRALTPSTGTETLFDHYAQLIKENRAVERGDHSIF